MTEKSNNWDWSPREADKYAEGPSDYEVVFRTAEFMVEKAMIDLDSEMKWVQELASRHPEEIIKNKDLVLRVVAEATHISQKLHRIISLDEESLSILR